MIFAAAMTLSSAVTMAQTEAEITASKAIAAATEQAGPEPKIITPGNYNNVIAPPSDAIVLFDGSDLSQWVNEKGTEAKWDIEDGILYTTPKQSDIFTKESFGDCQIHLEWMIPIGTTGVAQKRGNSGIYIQGLYEVQILDSYNNKCYVNGQAGSIYKQYAPLVNACQKQGEWNTYDIIFTAPTFKEDGSLKSQAKITVLHNGVLVQNDAILMGPTEFNKIPRYSAHGDRPIKIQDHHNRVGFRNIWVRKL